MKRMIILVAACIFMSSANMVLGQDDTEKKSTVMLDGSLYDVVFSWKKQKKQKPQAYESHWAGFSFAFSDLKNLPKEVELSLERSYSISWNVTDWETPIDRHWLLVSGFGFDWSRYHFGNSDFLKNVDGVTNFYTDRRELKDSKLLVYYAKIPLLLEYQIQGNRKTFFIQGGIEGLVKLYSKSRTEAWEGRHVEKDDYRNLKIYPVNMRLFLHAGFGSWGIFSYYQPFSMFQSGHGPELRTFGVGIALN